MVSVKNYILAINRSYPEERGEQDFSVDAGKRINTAGGFMPCVRFFFGNGTTLVSNFTVNPPISGLSSCSVASMR